LRFALCVHRDRRRFATRRESFKRSGSNATKGSEGRLKRPLGTIAITGKGKRREGKETPVKRGEGDDQHHSRGVTRLALREKNVDSGSKTEGEVNVRTGQKNSLQSVNGQKE